MPVVKSGNRLDIRTCKNGVYMNDDFRVDFQWQKRQAQMIVQGVCQDGDLPTGSLSVNLNDITDDMDEAEKLDVFLENNQIMDALDEIRCTLEFFESQKAQNEMLLKELKELDETNARFLQEILRLRQILQQHGIQYTSEDKKVEEKVREVETAPEMFIDFVDKTMQIFAAPINIPP